MPPIPFAREAARGRLPRSRLSSSRATHQTRTANRAGDDHLASRVVREQRRASDDKSCPFEGRCCVMKGSSSAIHKCRNRDGSLVTTVALDAPPLGFHRVGLNPHHDVQQGHQLMASGSHSLDNVVLPLPLRPSTATTAGHPECGPAEPRSRRANCSIDSTCHGPAGGSPSPSIRPHRTRARTPH